MLYLPGMKKDNDRTWLDDALRNKREDKTRLTSEKNALWVKYATYDTLIAQYQQKIPASNYSSSLPADNEKDKASWSIKKILIDYYENPPKHLGTLITSRRRKHELDSCPYCGKPVSPSTLDHFIPKEDWPEFAIYPDNLVPQCVDCAPIKGPKYYCSQNHCAKFIHPFYGSVLSNVGFHIIATLSNNEVTFKVKYKTVGVSTIDMPRVRLHIESLKMTRRIKEYCESLLKRIIRKAKKNSVSVKKIIECHIPEAIGENYLATNWEEAFYLSINQQDIINYIDAFRPLRQQTNEELMPNQAQYVEIE